jgi:hypothetical protein
MSARLNAVVCFGSSFRSVLVETVHDFVELGFISLDRNIGGWRTIRNALLACARELPSAGQLLATTSPGLLASFVGMMSDVHVRHLKNCRYQRCHWPKSVMAHSELVSLLDIAVCNQVELRRSTAE